MADDRSIDIKSIVRRFTESTDALDGLQERMKALTATAESLARTSTGVTEMSGQMRQFVGETSKITIMLRGATEKVQSAVEKAIGVLDGGDLSEVKSDLKQLKSMLEKQLKESQEELSKAQEESKRLLAELNEIKAKVAKLPEKVLRKHWEQ
jgi:chromosome segregation ATPase